MKVLGVIAGAIGIVLSLYFGLVVMFVGGIAATVDAVAADPVEGLDVAWGVARIVLAGTVTSLFIWGSIGLGIFMAALSND